jgi:hypothetical protein
MFCLLLFVYFFGGIFKLNWLVLIIGSAVEINLSRVFVINFFFKSFKTEINSKSLDKMSIFGINPIFGQNQIYGKKKLPFKTFKLEKYSRFSEKCQFLDKMSIFGQNVDFWTKCRFLDKIQFSDRITLLETR